MMSVGLEGNMQCRWLSEPTVLEQLYPSSAWGLTILVEGIFHTICSLLLNTYSPASGKTYCSCFVATTTGCKLPKIATLLLCGGGVVLRGTFSRNVRGSDAHQCVFGGRGYI